MATVVLIPGLACDETVWAAQRAALEPAHDVRVSDVLTRHDTLDAMAAALLAEHPGELCLAGASMGGIVALLAALAAPARVRALALLGSTARADTPAVVQLRRDAIALYEQGRVDEVLAANALFAFHPDHFERADLIEPYLAMIRRAGAAQLVRQNRAIMARADLRPRLAALRLPLLVACGEADLLTPPEHAREIAAAVPGARLEIVAGAGHMLTLEQPQRVAALLAGHFRS